MQAEVGNKIYDVMEFNRIRSIARLDPVAGLEAIKEYLKRYPFDCAALSYKTNLLILFGRFDEAEALIDYTEDIVERSTFYTNKPERKKQINKYILRNKLKIYMYEDRISEALKVFFKARQSFQDLNGDVNFYLLKMQGMVSLDKREKNGYLFRQITDYQEEDFEQQMRSRFQPDEQRNLKDPLFAPDFPIDEILVEVRKYIPSPCKLYTGFYDNEYIFRYDGCGTENNKLVDCFKVITFKDSDKLLEMFPTDKYTGMEYNGMPIDLNYLRKKDNVQCLAKTMNHIDRFDRIFNGN